MSVDSPIENVPDGCGWSEEADGVSVWASLRSIPRAVFWVIWVLGWTLALVFALIPPHITGMPGSIIWILPFAIIAIAVYGWVAAIRCAGTLHVQIGPNAGLIWTEIGNFSWKRRFATKGVREVREYIWRHKGGTAGGVEIAGDRSIRFGSMLNKQQRLWMISMLNEFMVLKKR